MLANRQVWLHIRDFGRRAPKALAFAVCIALIPLGSATLLLAQEAARAEARATPAPTREELGRLFDAVVETTAREFWDKDRLEGGRLAGAGRRRARQRPGRRDERGGGAAHQ